MSWVAVVAFGLVGAGALLALVRLARGPSLLDRVVAGDAMLVITAGGLGVHVALSRDASAVSVLVVVSLLGYIGAIAVVRYVGGMVLDRPSGDDPAGEERP
ncbi:monovalent cation/H+ antiporter complex subunit F [Geodermatophilus sp. SYSU D00867]